MSESSAAERLRQKSLRAARSARVLLELGDVDGACNRAYYAMFDAARAALLTHDPTTDPESVRTHRGLLRTFSDELVKPGRVSVELGRTLRRAESIRLVADYRSDSVELSDASRLVDEADVFVSTLRSEFAPNTPDEGRDTRGS